MDLLRLPWNAGGGQGGRPQFPLDHLFRRDDNRAAGGAGVAPDNHHQHQHHHPMGDHHPHHQQHHPHHHHQQQQHPHHNHYHQQMSKEYKAGTSPLQKVLDELNMSILPHDVRLNSIVEAAEHFDHRDKSRHNYELHEGAAKILYQKLAFVLTLQLSSYNSGSSYNVVTNGLSSSSSSSIGGGTHPSPFQQGANSTSDPISIQKIRSTRSQDASDADYEIALLTTCLEMVHRATPNAIANTWFSIGEESLPILIKILERPFHKIQSIIEKGEKAHQSASTIEKAITTMATNRETKVAVQKVTKILTVYSLLPAAKRKMATCPGLLAVLVKITDTHNMNRMKSMRPVSKRLLANNSKMMNGANNYPNSSSSSIDHDERSLVSQSTKTLHPPSTSGSTTTPGSNGIRGTQAGVGLYMTEASRFNAIAIMTNLAAVEKNRLLMLSEPGLVNNIARVVNNERSDVARQCSALAIMNLSNGDREHVPELAGNDLLLESIIKLSKDDVPETRRNAVIALFNVACADENTVKLVRYKDGFILDALMNIIEDGNDMNDEMYVDIKTTAAEALFNISCSSIIETTDRFANHPNLLETCALVLKNPIVSRDVKVYCAAIIRRMAEIIHFPKKCQLELLSAMVKASSWTRTACIAEAFLSQALVIENRRVMVEHHGLLNALSKLALVSGSDDGESDRVRSAAICAIENLSRETGRVRETLSKHEGIMLAMTRASYGRRSTNRSHVDVTMYHGEYQDDDRSNLSENHRNMQLALKRLVKMI